MWPPPAAAAWAAGGFGDHARFHRPASTNRAPRLLLVSPPTSGRLLCSAELGGSPARPTRRCLQPGGRLYIESSSHRRCAAAAPAGARLPAACRSRLPARCRSPSLQHTGLLCPLPLPCRNLAMSSSQAGQVSVEARAASAALGPAAATSTGERPQDGAQGPPPAQLGAGDDETLPVVDPVGEYEKIKRIGEGTFGVVCERAGQGAPVGCLARAHVLSTWCCPHQHVQLQVPRRCNALSHSIDCRFVLCCVQTRQRTGAPVNWWP